MFKQFLEESRHARPFVINNSLLETCLFKNVVFQEWIVAKSRTPRRLVFLLWKHIHIVPTSHHIV